MVVVVTTASTAFLFLVVGGVVKVFSGENLKKERKVRGKVVWSDATRRGRESRPKVDRTAGENRKGGEKEKGVLSNFSTAEYSCTPVIKPNAIYIGWLFGQGGENVMEGSTQ